MVKEASREEPAHRLNELITAPEVRLIGLEGEPGGHCFIK